MAGQNLQSLNDLFTNELKDILNAEKQITQALPKMIDAASSPQLKAKFEAHLKQTNDQIQRLNEVFSMLGLQPSEEHCEGMAGIIRDGEKIVSAQGDPAVKDAGIIAAAQKVEHYEISSYGTLRTFAQTLGRNDIAEKLQVTLKQEAATDEILTQVAERSVNKKAA
ncbi:MAG TPA: ferritin-like domain-containing protein [Armatimonadota bacterium]|nr:ferritin-like domain-containing protein [Armatimonadota bacterium]